MAGFSLKDVITMLGQTFDPEGKGYDYTGAIAAGIKPNEAGHWASRDPHTGMILKGRNHPTWDLHMKEEMKRGNMIVRRGGRYYSVRALGGLPE
jgi:hypothetical protein